MIRHTLFLRFYFCATGAVSFFSAAYLLTVTIIRLQGIAFEHRTTTIIFTLTFLASTLLQGIAWILLAMSNRLWKTDGN